MGHPCCHLDTGGDGKAAEVFHTQLGDSRQTGRAEFCLFFHLIRLVSEKRW